MTVKQEDRSYLIRKRGMWYRPNSQGYTNNALEAGLYTLEEARSYTHPNGIRGPRDGMTYLHKSKVPELVHREAAEQAAAERERELVEQIKAGRDTFRDCDILDDPIGAAAQLEAAMRNCDALLAKYGDE